MYIEIRKNGKSKKYYLKQSYRVGAKVKKIVKYLGSNLSKEQLNKCSKIAEKLILEDISGKDILEFELTKDEIKRYQQYDKKIKIEHLQKLNWEHFTEQFTYNTNAIEGSTVSAKEVKELLEQKDKVENLEEVETLNVAKAVSYIKKSKKKLSVALIKKLHLICFKGTKNFAGKIRKVEVVIRDNLGRVVHVGALAKEVNELLDELCIWYEKHNKNYPPSLLATIVHNQFEKIHPFQDGNGRVGRLLLNYILLKHKYPPINIRLKDRSEYYQCLQKYDQNSEIVSMLKFLIKEYRKQYK